MDFCCSIHNKEWWLWYKTLVLNCDGYIILRTWEPKFMINAWVCIIIKKNSYKIQSFKITPLHKIIDEYPTEFNFEYLIINDQRVH